MFCRNSQVRRWSQWCGGLLSAAALAMLIPQMPAQLHGAEKSESGAQAKQADLALGEELFTREWLPNDPRSHGGDGLGPVFNESSCVACHNQGGPGGGGPASKNVDIITAVLHSSMGRPQVRTPSLVERIVRPALGLQSVPQVQPLDEDAKRRQERERQQLAAIHPGFRDANSVVLHRFGTDEKYATWRQGMVGQPIFGRRGAVVHNVVIGPEDAAVQEEAVNLQVARDFKVVQREFERIQHARREMERVKSELGQVRFSRTTHRSGASITTTQRNATALFGAGLINSIPDEVIEAAAEKTYSDFPQIKGRVSRLKGGKIGRFGWKAQKESLYDFAMTACAVELGLQVPDHPQSGLPLNPNYEAPGLDMNREECDALVAYLSALPAPAQRKAVNPQEAAYLQGGKKLFAAVGCATCHTENLGDVEGIYSDLLLHDMGEEGGDTGDYGVFVPKSPGNDIEEIEEIHEPLAKDGSPGAKQVRIIGATRLEWRTPPLWGVRDSAPYLHDGRAETLEQAIAFHGGQAAVPAQRFFALKPEERQQVIAFLKSLTAPSPERLVTVSKTGE
jgi:CxxC motif-containing protein (DUF1111 family)